MINVTVSADGNVDVQATVRQPGVYLDQDSLIDISRTLARRQRFLNTLRTKGTLLFSWTNAFDLSGPQGDNVTRLREFLAAIGPNWVPIEMNPWTVARKENGDEPCSGSPGISESLLRNYYPHIHEGPLHLANIVDLIHDDRAAVQAELERLKQGADDMVQNWRNQFRADETCLDRLLPPLADVTRPHASLLRSLERQVTREARAFTWMPNDGTDFMHAAVAAVCSDFLVVDRQWKRRVLEVAPVRSYPWVYYRAELDNFLDAFERSHVGA